MSPTSYLAAPPRDMGCLEEVPSNKPNYNTKKKNVCQLFFRRFFKKKGKKQKSFFSSPKRTLLAKKIAKKSLQILQDCGFFS